MNCLSRELTSARSSSPQIVDQPTYARPTIQQSTKGPAHLAMLGLAVMLCQLLCTQSFDLELQSNAMTETCMKNPYKLLVSLDASITQLEGSFSKGTYEAISKCIACFARPDFSLGKDTEYVVQDILKPIHAAKASVC